MVFNRKEALVIQETFYIYATAEAWMFTRHLQEEFLLFLIWSLRASLALGFQQNC